MISPPPGEWAPTQLGNVVVITRRPRDFRLKEKNVVPFVPMEELPSGNLYLHEYQMRRPSEIASGTYFENGDLLLAKITPYFENGKQAIATNLPLGFGFATTEVFPLKAVPDKSFLPFVAFLLLAPEVRRLLAQKMEGATGRQRLPRSVLEKFPIALPLLPEQRAIAAVLGKLQEAVEVQEKIVATLRELKAATMAKLFREGLHGEPTKQTEIGTIPNSWKVARLGSHCSIESGGTPSRNIPEYWNGHIPWVKTGEINYRPIKKTEEHITREGLENSSARLFPKGTVLMAMYGQGVTRGKVALLEIEAATNQACAALFPKEGLEPGYLYSYFCYAYDGIRSLGHGANQKNLSAEIIREIFIPLPPHPDEQRNIFRTQKTIEMRIEFAEARENTLKMIFSSILSLLMTGQVRMPSEMIAMYGSVHGEEKEQEQPGRIDEAVIQRIVQRIVDTVTPEKIILFGSAARGEMGPDSDVDFLVIKSGVDQRETEGFLYRSLSDLPYPKDFIVVTPEDVERDKDDIGFVVNWALSDGKVVYANRGE